MADDAGQIESAPESAAPLDIAMDAERHDPAPDSPAREVLRKHARLLDEQIALACNERLRNRIKAARDLSLVAATVAALAAAVAVVWSAFRADGLVVEPFTTPPDLQARGLDGGAVSALLLDRVAHMQDEADSVRAPASFENDWGQELSVELPEAGVVSLGEAYQTLRRWLGEETRVSGQVFREGAGLTVVVRAGGLPARTVSGPEAELSQLLTRAAERLYEQTQPYRYAIYLDAADRNVEAVAVLRRLLRHPDPSERAWAYNGLCHIPEASPSARESVRLLKAGLQLEPRNTVLLGNLALYEEVLGHSHAALRTRRRILATPERDQNRFVDPEANGLRVTVLDGFARHMVGDFGGALEVWEKSAQMRENQGHVASAPFRQAAALAALHQPGEARRSLADLGVLGEGAAAREQPGWNLLVFPLADAAAEIGDWATARDGLLAADAVVLTQVVPRHWQRPTMLWPRLAYAEARLGRAAEADALIGRTPVDCYLCVRTRGKLAALQGDRGGADRWFAEAVRQGPSLPFAYSEWGEAKLARGDVDGAIRLFREAQERGPRWADPLKYEGDALARRREDRGAIRRYAEAADRAPRWGGLHLAWGRSLEALGREEQAAERYARALRLDLNAADRAEAQRRLREVRA